MKTENKNQCIQREYSRQGLFGIAVPQANPVVEPEFSVLMPEGTGTIATRLQGSRNNSKSRLIDYLDNLDASLSAFDTATLDVVGYACTGSSYLVGHEHEQRKTDELSNKFGYPIITSAQAILAALKHLGVSKIALIAPYPQWMIDISHQYWEQCGLTVTGSARTMLDTEDTRHVYQLRTEMVREAAAALPIHDAEAVLLSGTGMPTLRAIPAIAQLTKLPTISSNLCLAWAMLEAIRSPYPTPDPGAGETLIGGWSGLVSRL